jgi:thiamine-phosphate pyrophosphorylase
VSARIDFVQIREKELNTSVLYQLVVDAVGITKGSSTKLLVNDRSDIAAATGADGVHLTRQSLPTEVVRRTFGEEFLIGVSTHSAPEAIVASQSGADFAVFGPVFETASKSEYGEPQGIANLDKVCSAVGSFPVLALGGVTIEKVEACLAAGAQGVAGISMFGNPEQLTQIANTIRQAPGKTRCD